MLIMSTIRLSYRIISIIVLGCLDTIHVDIVLILIPSSYAEVLTSDWFGMAIGDRHNRK